LQRNWEFATNRRAVGRDDADLVAGRGCSECCSSRQDRRGCRQQTLLDVRVSRAFSLGGGARIELLVDMLNALNDKAEEGLVDDNFFSSNFALPSVFIDPCRAMLAVRFTFQR
jgi:hypothetical protein